MKKWILAIGIVAAFMLVAISFASAVNTTGVEKKESPLYGLRTRRAIGEKISNILETIKAKFLGNRIFLLPFQWLKNIPREPSFYSIYTDCKGCYSLCMSVYCACYTEYNCVS